MKLIAPSYYEKFRCIAGRCRHTCCAGWEVDIDEESLQRFKSAGVDYISEEETPHFILKEGDRCPFLNENNLCDMIIEHGEDFLCNICKDHPRFRNFWNDRVEIGLGLACEEAGRIILSETEPLMLVVLEDDGIEEEQPEDEQYLAEVMVGLLAEASKIKDPKIARLTEYFIYRQIPDALYDGLLDERIAFIEKAVDEISEKWNGSDDHSLDALVEIAREFSVRVEYNTELLNLILAELSEEN